MEELIAGGRGGAGGPHLLQLVGGFITLALGLGWLTRRRPDLAVDTPQGTRRALAFIAAYAACSVCFWRVLAAASLGKVHSLWLMALGDVIFVALGLFVWVMALAEGRPWRAYGFHMDGARRVVVTLVLGAVAAFTLALPDYGLIASGHVRITADSFTFAALLAALGSALPEEILFRGYLQGSLHGRANRWARLMLPALAFAAFRALRYLPGSDLAPLDWGKYVLGVALPLGMWWGLMRDLAGGSLWPSLVSHFVVEFGSALAHASPRAGEIWP